jgi:hypothetical protein
LLVKTNLDRVLFHKLTRFFNALLLLVFSPLCSPLARQL